MFLQKHIIHFCYCKICMQILFSRTSPTIMRFHFWKSLSMYSFIKVLNFWSLSTTRFNCLSPLLSFSTISLESSFINAIRITRSEIPKVFKKNILHTWDFSLPFVKQYLLVCFLRKFSFFVVLCAGNTCDE